MAEKGGDLLIGAHRLARTARDLVADTSDTESSSYAQTWSGTEHLRSYGNALTRWSHELRVPAGSIHIPGPVLIVSNPVAGNGRGHASAVELKEALSSMRASGMAYLRGPLEYMTTQRDPSVRVEDIAARITSLARGASGRRVTVVAMGGDKTASDVLAGAWQARQRDPSINAAVAIGPGGTANSLHHISGAPDDVWLLSAFLASRNEIPLHGLKLWFDGDANPHFSFYVVTFGVSGALFAAIEQKKTEGPVTVADYVALLPKTVLNAGDIYLRVAKNGHEVFSGAAGEVFGPLVAHDVGAITTLPGPAHGARLVLPPPMPAALVPLYEVILLKMLINAGFQFPVRPSGKLITISDERQIDLLKGDDLEYSFYDSSGEPMRLHGTLEGDYLEPVHSVRAELMDEPVRVITHPRAELMVRQGRVAPHVPFDGLTTSAAHYVSDNVQAFRGVSMAIGAALYQRIAGLFAR